MGKIQEFINDSKEEFSRVNWLSHKQSIRYTILVMVICAIFVGIFIILDWFFAQLSLWATTLFS